jgi:hypothetical protein
MITLNEIMVGNWIKGIALGQYHQVDAFFFHEWYDHIYSDDDTFGDWYEGIPLSPEILEKCGFEWDIFYQGLCNGRYVVNILHDGTISFAYAKRRHDEMQFIPYIKYLHQLQNIYYSLTQTELKIQLQP